MYRLFLLQWVRVLSSWTRQLVCSLWVTLWTNWRWPEFIWSPLVIIIVFLYTTDRFCPLISLSWKWTHLSLSGWSVRACGFSAAWGEGLLWLCHLPHFLLRQGNTHTHKYKISGLGIRLYLLSFDLFFSFQAKEEKQGGTVFIGRVAIPCAKGQEQVHRLVLSQQHLQQVHRLLMT